jgi:hypothetical protein
VKGDTQRREEERKYTYGIDVIFNKKAWVNEDTMLHWVKHVYQFSSAYSTVGIEREPRLLYLDAFSAHLTPAVISEFKRQGVTVSVIPGGCTGYIQPLDTSINKTLKDLIKEEQDEHFDKNIIE